MRRAARMRTVFYLVVLIVALTGQVTGATQELDIHLLIAIPAVAALELGGVVVMANADVRRRLGERAIASRILSAAIAAGAVAFNWLAHDNHLLGGFFAGMSALGYLVWLTHAENVRRDRLRATGALPATSPAYEVGHWLRHPLITWRARSMAKADPGLGLYGSLHAARTVMRREHRDAAIAKILRRKIKAAVDPTTATIALHVYDLEQIAARLAATADYDALTNLIAADLAPARIAVNAEWGKWRFSRRGTRAQRLGSEHPPPKEEPLRPAPAAPEDEPPTEPVVTKARPDPRARADSNDVDQLSAGPEDKRINDQPTPAPTSSPNPGPVPDTSTPMSPDTPEATHSHSMDGDSDQLPAAGDRANAPDAPVKTAAAVAYWLRVDPHMEYRDIAKRIGKTERTVRRSLPPNHQPPRARNRTQHRRQN
ncbi:hypothetical protein [Micromonospora echinofusca]|uniref:DUF2637 domain-containing protein n=1 Tax=Micromonospora echinofusca TaxID=47858 RepID=A0ABS3VSQ4_MICEH|nr:hypothetical protein [Micromonospora echinofusca]MBO4207550.1 hypothetical protein [Micromonospora echinofusca]